MSVSGRYFKGLRRPNFSTMKVSASSSVAKGFASMPPGIPLLGRAAPHSSHGTAYGR
jgi:hypothetical protein